MGLLNVTVDEIVREKLDQEITAIEGHLDADAMTIYGPIVHGMDTGVRNALEEFEQRKARIAILLDTPGGVVEVVERMVEIIRHMYDEVWFIIPDRAMSAGTIFAMSGDRIFMDYFSRLGPIDPQVEKDGKLVPALSYLVQFRRMLDKDRQGDLTSAEFALLANFDLAELHQYEQARDLSITLLRKWLATYKFKNWTRRETSGKALTEHDREQRAEEIARILSDNEQWHSHGRGMPPTHCRARC